MLLYTTFSNIPITRECFLCIQNYDHGPKQDLIHRSSVTLLMKQTLYHPATTAGWIRLKSLNSCCSGAKNQISLIIEYTLVYYELKRYTITDTTTTRYTTGSFTAALWAIFEVLPTRRNVRQDDVHPGLGGNQELGPPEWQPSVPHPPFLAWKQNVH